uniref:Uncharacterized protein n=1 Tax=Anopheles culicifacies TaxID=139723 RepID=A0A182MU37_9DIPT
MKPYDNGAFAPRHFVSEWEDNVVFDADDPDFSVGGTGTGNVLMRSTTGSQQIGRQFGPTNMTRSVTTYYGLNSASVVSNLNQLMKDSVGGNSGTVVVTMTGGDWDGMRKELARGRNAVGGKCGLAQVSAVMFQWP